MPLGIVSSEDFEREVNNSSIDMVRSEPEIRRPNNIVDQSNEVGPIVDSSTIIRRYNEKGRKEGDVNVPQSIRKLISDTATFDGRKEALALASDLGISAPSVAAYTNPHSSASSLSETNKNDISNFLTDRKQKISKRAINKLAMAINHIDNAKLEACGPVALSNVAKNMAQVVKHMEPSSDGNNVAQPVQFVMFAPQVRNENHYETVVAKDNY